MAGKVSIARVNPHIMPTCSCTVSQRFAVVLAIVRLLRACFAPAAISHPQPKANLVVSNCIETRSSQHTHQQYTLAFETGNKLQTSTRQGPARLSNPVHVQDDLASTGTIQILCLAVHICPPYHLPWPVKIEHSQRCDDLGPFERAKVSRGQQPYRSHRCHIGVEYCGMFGGQFSF